MQNLRQLFYYLNHFHTLGEEEDDHEDRSSARLGPESAREGRQIGSRTGRG